MKPWLIKETSILLSIAAICITNIDATKAIENQPNCKNISEFYKNKALNFSDLINLGLCNDPKTKESFEATMIQKHSLKKGYSDYMPRINAQASYRENKVNAETSKLTTSNPNLISIAALTGGAINGKNDIQSYGINFDWLIYDFGSREAGISILKEKLKEYEYLQSNASQEIIFKITSLYYQYLSSEKELEAAIENEKLTTTLIKNAEIKQKSGLASKLDKLQAESANAQAMILVLNSNAKLNIVKQKLKSAIHYSEMPLMQNQEKRNIITIAERQNQMKNIETQINSEAKNSNHPLLKAAAAKINQQNQLIKKVILSNLPRISAIGGINKYDINSQGDFNINATNRYIGGQITLPIFSGFSDIENINIAKRQRDFEIAQKESLERNIEDEIIESYEELKAISEGIVYAENFLKVAIEAEKNARERYKLGVGNIIDVIHSQSNLISAKENNAKMQYGWWISKARFQKAMGMLYV